MKNVLAVLVAKSGIALEHVLPKDWERIVVDFSRLDQRSVEFWSQPQYTVYDEIYIVDRNVVTGLTQLHVERALKQRGIKGPIQYVATVKSELGLSHQNFVIEHDSIVPCVDATAYSLSCSDNYLVVLVGLPGSAKTMIRKLFEGFSDVSTYKWGAYAQSLVEKQYGICTMETVAQFTRDVERNNRVVVAQEFLNTSGIHDDVHRVVVLDGIKTREQIIYVSYVLNRPVIIVHATLDEQARKHAVIERNDFDDSSDTLRLQMLSEMGVMDVFPFADFCVHTDGNSVVYHESDMTCAMSFAPRFVANMHEVFEWLRLSSSLEETDKVILGQAKSLAVKSGYHPVEKG
ncbi:MAG: hypothetical protein COV44_10590 [Deltaproteobacteria bacterium CG11_big_fil_rev_8_21_14_0_20_45_16]|nr:MAG: hypothetical protein COV44_10590 [Deltaproteobacteria bacterium CG11_big_fil_rev_8_21_14_0_20_45_16]